VLAAGRYVAVVRAKRADDAGSVQLKFEQADAPGAIVLGGPGVYVGDTRMGDDSVPACSPPPPDPDGMSSPAGAHDHDGMAHHHDPMSEPMSAPSGMSEVGGDAAAMGGHDDIYVLASCPSGLIVSTCGTSDFDTVIDVRTGSTGGASLACSAGHDACTAATRGASVSAQFPAGLTFVIVDGSDEGEAGHYQMSLVY
jgi:hypothetical protein